MCIECEYMQSVWEKQRKGSDNPLARLLASWNKVHCVTEATKESPTQSAGNMSLSEDAGGCDETASEEDVLDEDCIQDLEIDSDD